MSHWTRKLAVILTLGTCAVLYAQTNDDVARGRAVFDNYCIHCHGTDTYNSGATEMLDAKYGGAVPGALEDRTTLTPAFIREFVRGSIGMAPYRPTEIPDSDLEDLTSYLMRNNP
ncbi:c-type cytochrome [Candidatus Rariloculus sp.]|uniref:c-type cytochrome n=1 Tax=Candidatus Rariloculus sp. TaxID=3101265 RepID=UPI003D0CD063